MMHELRYFQEVHAVSPNIDILWQLKCRYIVKDLFREPQNLKIFFDGKEEWFFDYLPTKSEASKVLVEASLPRFEVAKINNKIKYRGRK